MKYRSEIDGLRAVAVVPVILFHAGFEVFSGGFVGVDVFFVISGYLITTIIISEIDEGEFSLLNFYERRARRILPALFFVMLCCLPFAWFLLSPSDMKDFSQSLVAVATFSSNILFWRESGYFDTAAELKPLLHTWSLAVEEQFYILFPLFLMAAWRFGRRAIVWTLFAAFALSLVTAQWGAHNKPAATFYLLPARAWELLIGASAAFYLQKRPANVTLWLSNFLSGVGLAAILYGVFVFDEATPFPSLYALAPTVGTALIILFAVRGTATHALLSLKAFVGVGLISYSLYLWHQPVFAFWRHYYVVEPDYIAMLILSLTCVLLAYFTYRLVEAPLRKGSFASRKHVLVNAVVASMFLAGTGLIGSASDGFSVRYPSLVSFSNTMVRSERARACFDVPQAEFREDWLCRLGGSGIGSTPEKRILIFGDSHAYSVFPAFERMSEQHNVEIMFVGYSGCIPFLGVYALRSDQEEKNCYALNQRVFEFSAAEGLDAVVLVARWEYYTFGGYSGDKLSYISTVANGDRTVEDSRAAFVHGLATTINEYNRVGVNLIAIDQVPMQQRQPDQIYVDFLQNGGPTGSAELRQFSIRNASFASVARYYRDRFQSAGFELTSVNDFFCDELFCTVGSAQASYYFDDDHLSVYGANSVSDLLWSRMFD